ncbi:MAG: aminodeoxychorismate synthase component I [Solirubrobacteraceae bacterium]|nr:aminodeoxychorismate synthase component I [Solirubrobacteraceae bacterium]
MRTLLIDNYDSYTYNLCHLLGEVNGVEPLVVRNDESSWGDLLASEQFDNVVISPGPGRPERARDVGISLAALDQSGIPVLGVCLGHQALAHVCGGTIDYARELFHGRLSAVQHEQQGLFEGLPQPFMAVRYHSLVVSEMPEQLRVTARSRGGVVMGIEHRERPLWGVQFHPESVCTEDGLRLIENFRDLSLARLERPLAKQRPVPATAPQSGAPQSPQQEPATVGVHHLRLGEWCEPETVFAQRYGDREHVIWLDSARAEPGLARFSFIATADGPLGQIVSADSAAQTIRVEHADGSITEMSGSIFDYCSAELQRLRAEGPKLPFGFVGGFAGYFGYEMGAECGATRTHSSQQPDAGLLFCDRVIAFDHHERRVHLLALADRDGDEVAELWLRSTTEALRVLGVEAAPPPPLEPEPSVFTVREDRAEYLERIAQARRLIEEGESYEVCLTTELTSPIRVDPLATYRRLRAGNPAPHAALLRFGELSVLSSSPERFLSVSAEGVVESKPIKGTSERSPDAAEDARRAEALQADEKSRAENLMIADLVRNDLGRVCELGSVHVPALMVVERYATVHQLVSIIRGQLREGKSALDAACACFPAGSMTGAPKLRTLEIIDRLEDRPRGIYSGALGYLSVNGSADLSVVIRTIVATPEGLSIGAGGAIVAASDPEAEYEEMLLKARPLVEASGGTIGSAAPMASAQ